MNGDLAAGWIQDTSLLKHWVDPGSEVLAEVDRAQASRLAVDLGVPGLDLDGEPVAVDRDGDGVLSRATERPQDDAINEGEPTTTTGVDTGLPGEPAALTCDERGQPVRGGGRDPSLEPSAHSETLAALNASPYARVSDESRGDTQVIPLSGKALQAVKTALGKSSSDPSAQIRVELHTHEGVVGEIRLAGGVVAVGSNDVARATISDTVIVWPGRPPTRVTPEDGERYLRALPVNLRGSYFWAELKEVAGEVVWRDLPTVVRRSYNEWVTRFQERNPGSNFHRDAPPRRHGDAYVVPFQDVASGARYQATVTAKGAVSGARRFA